MHNLKALVIFITLDVSIKDKSKDFSPLQL